MPCRLKVLIFLLFGTLIAPVAGQGDDFESQRAGNWHQWRGPYADGVAALGDPPVEWGEQRNVRWKTAIPGRGSASPVIWNDQVFLLTAVPQENTQRFVVMCLDRATGKILWERVAIETTPRERLHPTNTHASASAITNGKRVYASFGSYGVYCYDMAGNLQWQRDLGDMQTRNEFGEGASPALHGDTLVVNWDHEAEDFIVALNAQTGEVRWKQDRDEPTTWATPLIVSHEGRVQVVTNGNNRARSYDLETGELLWECGGQAMNPIPSPVTLDGVAYCMTGFRGYAAFAIPLGVRGDVTDSDKILWSKSDGTPYISSPVLYKGTLYYTKGRDAILSSVDAKTGEVLIDQKRLQGLDTMYASPVAAADRIYWMSRNGTGVVIRHGKELEILATNKLDEGVDASPAIMGKQMFVRGERSLYCLEDEAPAASNE
jgi:outer membrane protein assembly factor BamB